MNMITKNSIYREHLPSWLAARGNKKKRGEIAKSICTVAGVHPKSVSRSFARIQMSSDSDQERRGRKTYYTPDVIAALKYVWNTASEPCGENLCGVIAEYVRILKRDELWDYPDDVTKKLLLMSLGTIKKRTSRFQRKHFITHGKSSTKAGAIHSLIPVRSGDWDKATVGTQQIDTVAHCGHTLAGDFIYTVNSTDVATLWGSRRCQWNKGKIVTVESMEYIENDVPFGIVEWHPDSGSEFINWHGYGRWKEKGVALTPTNTGTQWRKRCHKNQIEKRIRNA